jgi:superfamily II DNA helicase RecQ
VVHVIEAMVRAGVLSSETASFERDGERVSFVRIRLVNGSGRANGAGLRVSKSSAGNGVATRSKASAKRPKSSEPVTALHLALRDFRKSAASASKVPAFRIFSDRVLVEIAERKPRDLHALQSCSGVGPATAKKYGEQILKVVREYGAG